MFAHIKATVKRTIRRRAGQLQDFLRRLEEEAEERRGLDRNDFAYPRLNALFTRLMREERGMYPFYAWGVLHAAHLAKALDISRISVIEFGVAGGRGLLCLDRLTERVHELLGVRIDAYGFDTGVGLPRPLDHRDHPNLYTEGTYRMEFDKLKQRLKHAELILGLVEDTVPRFLASARAPIGFVSIDVDYYTSTAHALKIFDAEEPQLLPRVHCYMDDILGFTCSEFAGERLAIDEFNQSHKTRKFSPIFGLKYFLPRYYRDAQWSEMMYLLHCFDHSRYGAPDGLVLRPSTALTD